LNLRPQVVNSLPQTLDPGTGADDLLPNYTPDADPADCRADNLLDSYEKVVDHTYSRGQREEITTTVDIGIANECLAECTRLGSQCLAVTLQNERGGRQRCFSHTSSAGADGTDPSSSTGVTYFEKICQSRTCNKDWSYTRVIQYEFVGAANEEVRDVQSRSACRELCLGATTYLCRSATYSSNFGTCKLSEEDRRTAPASFRPAQRGTDYLENECADLPANCEYIDLPGSYLPFTDTYIANVANLEACRDECNRASTYNCRSFNYNAARKECFLSADDSISLPTGLQQDQDFTFSERAGCNNVKVECTPSDMLVTLSFGQAFSGRIYATGNPQACFELGNGASEMTLRIPIGTQCGTVQSGRGRYVNHVVIQANPVIMQDTDKTVRVECAFTAEDQTVSFRPTAGPDGREDGGGISVTVPFQPTGTNIVTNTAPTPGVRMRVVRNTGSTADVVGLGEDLQLRIEIDQDSAFGLFARTLEARTDNGELLNLIDATGCPVNELIFPALNLEDASRALAANFKAFRFPSTPTVNFVATVQFCQDVCDPVTCTGNLDSYGRRRRRSVGNETLRGGRSIKPPDNLLPEQMLLGLRLTVGEDQVTKPLPPSQLGERRFPDQNPAGPAMSPYYPGLGGGSQASLAQYDIGDPSYVCSPQSTIIAVLMVIGGLFLGLIAGFVFFYRMKRKHWSKVRESDRSQPPPLPPHHPRAAGGGGAVYSNTGQEVLFKSAFDAPPRAARFQGNPTMAGMSRQNQ